MAGVIHGRQALPRRAWRILLPSDFDFRDPKGAPSPPLPLSSGPRAFDIFFDLGLFCCHITLNSSFYCPKFLSTEVLTHLVWMYYLQGILPCNKKLSAQELNLPSGEFSMQLHNCQSPFFPADRKPSRQAWYFYSYL